MTFELENPITQRFNSISWHDSKLVGFELFKSEEEDRVRLSLELLGEDGSLTPTKIVFNDCVYCQTNVYLAAKSMCSDAISNAKCYESSDWKRGVSEPSPYDPIRGGRGFDDYLHFNVSLCPPGGTISILARDFFLEKVKG